MQAVAKEHINIYIKANKYTEWVIHQWGSDVTEGCNCDTHKLNNKGWQLINELPSVKSALHHQGEFSQHSEKAMSYKYNTWQNELRAAFLAQFVCTTKPLISLSGWSCWRWTILYIPIHQNNDLTMSKSCTKLKSGIRTTQKLFHIYPSEVAFGGASVCGLE